jgi:PAS domain S-box-containing protein
LSGAPAFDPPVFDEVERRRVIDSYDVRGALALHALDDVSDFAARLCEAPVALVTLIEEEEQHFLARVGTEIEGTPRDISFCAHAIGGSDLMEVRDASADPRFADNPLVTGETHVRFYAGAPLIAREGVPLGGVCVLDTEPRPEGLSATQRDGLLLLADLVMRRLEDHRRRRERGVAKAESARALADSEVKFRTLADTMPQMVWSTQPDGFHDYYNARWYEFTGAPTGSTDGEGWNGMFHPEDQERAWTVWRGCLLSGEPYEIEYRLRHFDGTYRWVLGRALPVRDGSGVITRWFGTCTDIHEQKLAQESREIVSQELSHRIKNIFAVIAGLISFAARGKPEFAPAAADLRQRITALGRAHDFVRPHSAQSRPQARQDSLRGLLGELFEAYAGESDPRIRVTGEDLTVDDRSATPLALLFHELATNATKYGSLSVADGTVNVHVASKDGTVTVTWVEAGGPPIVSPPSSEGFGSQLIELSAVRQLDGTVSRDWARTGLRATLTAPVTSFRRD